YAYHERRGLNNRFRPGEGLVGQCVLEKERILVTDVPEGYVQVNSGLGSAPPRNIVVLPILFEGEVKAVVELASFQPFNQNHLTFLDQLSESIGIVLNSIEANMRTEALLAQSQGLTQELQSQQEELQQTNRRLEEQARSLRESEDLLRQQQEELQQTNVALEEKARQLAVQNAEVERKNAEIEQARKALEEKAEQLALTSKYKSEFLANMSHELRTPLNSMLILSRMLAENGDGALSPKQVEYAETIYSSGSDLLALINEILDLSKIESGAMPVEAEPVAFDALAADLDRMFREVANDRNLTFTITRDEALPEALDTDPKRLQQVLKKLLSNAFKFTHEGSVELRMFAPEGVAFRTRALRQAGQVVGFAVADTGIGIAPEKQRVIFEAFQQAEGSVDRTYGGTGLGLSISREIARLLGGEIHLQSAPGRGSTFTLYLPLVYTPPTNRTGSDAAGGPEERASDRLAAPVIAGGDGISGPPVPEVAVPPAAPADRGDDDHEGQPGPGAGAAGPAPADVEAEVAEPAGGAGEAAPEEAPPAEVAPRVHHGPVRDDRDALGPDDSVLLVVEDDPHFARVLVDIAREKGFKVIVVEHAEGALDAVRRFKPSAITLDVKLPGMHGLALLDRLKNQPETRHIPVQIVSVTDRLPHGERRGVFGHLKKPVSRDAVEGQLDRAKALVGRPVRRLLVVEDNEVQRRLVEEFIGGEDVEMVGVARGQEALDALAAGEPFDCALVDLGLPDMSGFELIERIRGELGLEDLPIIVHTGRDLTPEEADRLHAHAEAVVVKDVEAFDRLLDETALYLHRVEAALPEEQRERLERRHRPEASLAGHRVLIVDDDVRNIFALQSLLERHKMEVVYAESGRDGIEFLKKDPGVDVVLMDVMMPGMDGY